MLSFRLDKFTTNIDIVTSWRETLYSTLTATIFIGGKMQPAGSFETLVAIYENTQRHFPEACNIAGI
jgi:hypothetical protein